MTLYKNRYRIKSARLPEWDYSSAAWYFVTICARDHHCVFGDIINSEMVLSPVGSIVAEEWHNTPTVRDYIDLDAWVIMPNHLHGIIVINDHPPPVETSRRDVLGTEQARSRETRSVETSPSETGRSAETRRPSGETRRPSGSSLRGGSLGAIVGQFKSVCTKRIRATEDDTFAWQSRFYDHVIRDERSLDKIRTYIDGNPIKWESDKNNPVNIPPVETSRRGVLADHTHGNVETSRWDVLPRPDVLTAHERKPKT